MRRELAVVGAVEREREVRVRSGPSDEPCRFISAGGLSFSSSPEVGNAPVAGHLDRHLAVLDQEAVARRWRSVHRWEEKGGVSLKVAKAERPKVTREHVEVDRREASVGGQAQLHEPDSRLTRQSEDDKLGVDPAFFQDALQSDSLDGWECAEELESDALDAEEGERKDAPREDERIGVDGWILPRQLTGSPAE